MEQSVSSSLPTLQKRKVREKNTSEKPNGCVGSQVIQMKGGKLNSVEIENGDGKKQDCWG